MAMGRNTLRTSSVIALILVLICSVVLGSTFFIHAQSVEPFPADIHITADGSVTGTDKIQRDGDIYLFADTVPGSIVVERSNIIINGANHILQGPSLVGEQSNGLSIYHQNSVTVRDLTVQGFGTGIWLLSSSKDVITNCKASISINNKSNNNSIDGCIMSGQYSGQYFGLSIQSECQYNIIQHNLIANTPDGIDINNCQNNTISFNTISGCSYYGLFMEYAWANTLTSNNIVDNRVQVTGLGSGGNYWNGNFWSDLGTNTTYIIEYGVSELTGKPSSDIDNHPASTEISNTFVSPTPTFTASPSPSPILSPSPTQAPSPSVPEFPAWITHLSVVAVTALALLVYFRKTKNKAS